MNDLQQFAPIAAGILGTAVMSLFTLLCFKVYRRPYYVVRSLALILNYGKQATLSKKVAPIWYPIAVVLHYGIGVLFSYAYILMFGNNFSFASTLIFGVLIGVVGIAGWKIFLMYNEHPLNLDLKIYFTVLWIGHVLLAITMFYSYRTIEVAEYSGFV